MPDPLSLNSVGGGRTFDWALLYVSIFGLGAVAWFTVRGLARRKVLVPNRVYLRLDPLIQGLRSWITSSPATGVYCATWIATTIIVMGSPPVLVDALTRYNSTNIAEIVATPVRALAVSALLVADRGFGLAFYVLVFTLIVARLEQRLGAPRTIVIWLVSHCGASLVTVWLEAILIAHNAADKSLALTADVGVSYVMVGSLGAYLFLVGNRWRPWYFAAVGIGILGPLILSHQIVDLGHVLALTLGALTGWLLIKGWGVRPAIRWKTLTSVPPRELVQDSAVRSP